MRFSERLLGALDLARLLDELLDALLEVTQADKGFLILFEDGEMTVRAARNVARETIENAMSPRLRLDRPAGARDPASRWSSPTPSTTPSGPGRASVVNLKLCSVMCAPLMQKGEVFGVIYLGNDNVVSLFDERALEALTVFAAQASLLVQNAMLLDSLRRENVALQEAVAVEAVRRPHRRRRVDARGLPAHREGGRHRHLRARLRRDRHREGGGGAGDPPALAAGAGGRSWP